MSRRFEYRLIIETGSDGPGDMARVEELISLSFKDLIYDEAFVSALGETQSISSQVVPILDNRSPNNG